VACYQHCQCIPAPAHCTLLQTCRSTSGCHCPLGRQELSCTCYVWPRAGSAAPLLAPATNQSQYSQAEQIQQPHKNLQVDPHGYKPSPREPKIRSRLIYFLCPVAFYFFCVKRVIGRGLSTKLRFSSCVFYLDLMVKYSLLFRVVYSLWIQSGVYHKMSLQTQAPHTTHTWIEIVGASIVTHNFDQHLAVRCRHSPRLRLQAHKHTTSQHALDATFTFLHVCSIQRAGGWCQRMALRRQAV